MTVPEYCHRGAGRRGERHRATPLCRSEWGDPEKRANSTVSRGWSAKDNLGIFVTHLFQEFPLQRQFTPANVLNRMPRAIMRIGGERGDAEQYRCVSVEAGLSEPRCRCVCRRRVGRTAQLSRAQRTLQPTGERADRRWREESRTRRLDDDEQRRIHGGVFCVGKSRRRRGAAQLAAGPERTRVHPQRQRDNAADLRRRVPRLRCRTALARFEDRRRAMAAGGRSRTDDRFCAELSPLPRRGVRRGTDHHGARRRPPVHHVHIRHDRSAERRGAHAQHRRCGAC